MAADGGQPHPPAGGYRPNSLFHWLSDRVNVRLFMAALAAKRSIVWGRTEGGSRPEVIRASDYLEICRENALDAHTIEDAIYWHNEIITELSIELHSIHVMNWPETVKASMTISLKDHLSHHAASVTRLAGILERNEQLLWQP
jgi:hypothetical protein